MVIMLEIKAYAIRIGKTIEVTISGLLPNSCHQACIEDIYPGGKRIYIVDPGAAQVFIKETLTPGSAICLLQLIPWAATVSIPDKSHKKCEIFVNNHEVLEVPVLDFPVGKAFMERGKKDFIVIALTGSPDGTTTGCSIVPKDAHYLAIYSQVYGPASYAACESWISEKCEH
jgi:hypothetical protein